MDTLQNLTMDIYQPYGDVATNRALILLAHGGSFLKGNSDSSDILPFCKSFAKMGYVVASINYRMGMTHQLSGGPPDSTDLGAAAMRATQDARAAVRYFRKNAGVGGNTYNIDTNNIFFLGVSAGAMMATQLAYCDQQNEFPSYIDTTGITIGNIAGQYGLHGGIQGLSGNAGYPSNVNAIISICGSINDTTWMHTGDAPVLCFHGTADPHVPYSFDTLKLFNVNFEKVYGDAMVCARAAHQGIPNCLETWLGQGHVPEVKPQNPAHYAQYYDSCITISRTFLEHYICGTPANCSYSEPLEIYELQQSPSINVYPNPANTATIVNLTAFNLHSVRIDIYNYAGQKVKSSTINANEYILPRDDLPAGIYFITISSKGKIYTRKLVFE